MSRNIRVSEPSAEMHIKNPSGAKMQSLRKSPGLSGALIARHNSIISL